MRTNLHEFASLCDELADWGIDEITFNQLGGRDRPENFAPHALRSADVAALADLLPALRARLATRGVRLCGDGNYLERIRANADGRALPGDGCEPGEQFLFVDEGGRIAPCSFTGKDYGIGIGELRTVADLHDLPARFAAMHAATRCTACADCPSTHVFTKFAA